MKWLAHLGVVFIYLLVAAALFLVAYQHGKRDADRWYASDRERWEKVIFENGYNVGRYDTVTGPTNGLLFWMNERGEVCRASKDAEHGVTCLHLDKAKDGMCYGWGEIWWQYRACPLVKP